MVIPFATQLEETRHPKIVRRRLSAELCVGTHKPGPIRGAQRQGRCLGLWEGKKKKDP